MDHRSRSWRQLAALAIGLLAAGASPAAATELANGGLELGAGVKIDGWTPHRWEGQGTIEATQDVALQGRQSVVINGFGTAKQAIFQRLELKPCSYRLTAAGAAYGATPNQWKQSGALHLAFAGGRNMTHNFATGDVGWRRMELVFTVAASERPVHVYIFNYGGGRIFVDDINLEAISGCPTEPDKFTLSPTVEKQLAFAPPITAEDRVLEGYCARADFAGRPVCRRLQGAAAKPQSSVTAPTRSGPLAIADFDTLNPFELGTRTTDKAIGGAKSGVVSAGNYIAARAAQGLLRDWSGYDWLRFDVDNASPVSQQLLVELQDDKTTGYWSRVNWYTYVAPGRSVVEVPLQAFVGEKSVIGERRRLDLTAMRVLAISQAKTELIVDNLRLEIEPPLRTPFPELIALDAGTGDSPVMSGFTPFTASTVYRPERGWGLIPGTTVARSEDRRHPDNLYRDWISFTGGGLLFELPNGEYTVWMMLEDPGYWNYYPFWRSRSVFIQDKEVVNERPAMDDILGRYYRHASDEDWPGDNIWANYIQKRYTPKTFRATVTNGQLSVRFKSESDPYATALSALVVYPTARAKEGAAFLAELDRVRERQFNAEYRQIKPLVTTDPLPPANALGDKLWVFRRPITQEILATDKPAAGELVTGLSATLARGQIEPLTVGLHVAEPLDLIGAELSLPGLQVTPYKVRYKVKRMTEDGTIYMSRPLVLDPLALGSAKPLRLEAGTSRRLWFDIKAPVGTKPGLVEGQLTLRFAGGGTHVLPVKTEIYPWTLPTADVPFGYLGVAPSYPSVRFPEVVARRAAEMETGIDLLADWGMTAASGGLSGLRFTSYRDGRPLIDFTGPDVSMSAIRRRFTGEVLTYDGFQIEGGLEAYKPYDTRATFARPYEHVIKDVLDRVAEHAGTSSWLPLLHVVGDEPSGAEAINNSIAVAQAIKKARPGNRTAVFTSFTKPGDPAAALAGKVDRIYVAHHSEASLAHIAAQGSECSLYNRQTRFERGIYLFKLRRLGCRGHMMFAFSSVHADPWYGLDGREDEWVAVYAHPDGVLRPSVDFARYRVAIDDYRTLLALEQAIAGATPGPARTAAAAWLASIESRTAVGHDAARAWPDEALDGVRAEAARHLQTLDYRGTPDAPAPLGARRQKP